LTGTPFKFTLLYSKSNNRLKKPDLHEKEFTGTANKTLVFSRFSKKFPDLTIGTTDKKQMTSIMQMAARYHNSICPLARGVPRYFVARNTSSVHNAAMHAVTMQRVGSTTNPESG
jgi:hypothetical protein